MPLSRGRREVRSRRTTMKCIRFSCSTSNSAPAVRRVDDTELDPRPRIAVRRLGALSLAGLRSSGIGRAAEQGRTGEHADEQGSERRDSPRARRQPLTAS